MREQFYIIHRLFKDYIEEVNRLKDKEIAERRKKRTNRTTQSREDSPSSQQYDLDIDDIEDIAGGLI